jgi:hypothetical protein
VNKIANSNFNENLDDYINKRQNKSKLHAKNFNNIKSKQKKNDVVFDESEESDVSERKLSFSLATLFRKRIPDETEIERKQQEKAKEQKLSEMVDDDEVVPSEQGKTQIPNTQNVKPQVTPENDDEDFEDSDDDKEIQETPRNKKEGGFMSKLFNFGSKKQEKEENDNSMAMQEQQQNIEDLKETIKVLHRWLEKLPPDKIYEFKRSPDFEKYKDGLRKLGLIKE